jgi:hypothetical protein
MARSTVARMEPTGRRKSAARWRNPGIHPRGEIPEFAEPVIGRTFARPVGSVGATAPITKSSADRRRPRA